MGGIGDLGECVQAPISRRFAPNDCSALAPLGACSQAITISFLTLKRRRAEKNKYVIYRDRSVRMGKNCALGLEYGPRPSTSGRTQDLGHSFFPYGPPARQITYIYLRDCDRLFKDKVEYFYCTGDK